MTTPWLDAFDEFALERMAGSALPGLAYCFVKDGRRVHWQNHGFADLERRTAVSQDTLFGLGSVTKLFTAVGVMQLIERGLVDLQAPVAHYIDFDIEPQGEPVRVWHFLTHSSGLPCLGYSESKLSPRWFMHGLPVNTLGGLQSFLRGAGDWSHNRPGERWYYLNEGYILLGAIIEAVTGKSYRDYIQEAILDPTGMSRTHFRKEAVEAESDVATQYMLDRQGRHFVGSNLYGEIQAAGGLVSSVNDLSKFAAMIALGGRTPTDNQIISSQTLALMSEPRLSLPYHDHDAFGRELPGPITYNQGYGFQVMDGFFGQRVVAHGGGVMGGTSYLAVAPDSRACVVLLSNGHGYPLSQLALYGLALLLDSDADSLPFRVADRALNPLEGHYESFRGTIMADVTRKGGFLELRLVFGNEDRIVPLVPEQVEQSEVAFFTLSGGRRSRVEFRNTGDGTELVYERYKFRKLGPGSTRGEASR